MRAEERIIVALDVSSLESAKQIIQELRNYISIYKIGSRLFTIAGPESVKMVKEAGAKVFLDLKLHDIPNTVAEASEAIARLNVDMFDVHTLGGKEMMKAAKEASKPCGNPLVFGVTILTHLDGDIMKEELGIGKSVEEEVLHLAKLAVEAGLDGVICSPREITAVRKICGSKLIITPGVRPEWAKPQDQKRTLTPKQAIEAGADYIVIGRPIIKAPNRQEAVERMLDEVR